jgi:hypothetical protein
MKKIVFSAGIVFALSGPVFAQQTLLGKYSGSFTQTSRLSNVSVGLSLEILSVDGDTVKGKAVRYAIGKGACAGEYPVEGNVKGDVLELKATQKGGPSGDCGMTLRLTVEGNKLVGTMNDFNTQLSK